MKSFSNLLTILAAASCFLSGRATETTTVCPGPIDVTYEPDTNLQLASLQISDETGDVVFRTALSQVGGDGVTLQTTMTLTVWASGPKFTGCIENGRVDLIIDAGEIEAGGGDDFRRLRTRKRMLTPSNKIVFGAVEFSDQDAFLEPKNYVLEACETYGGKKIGSGTVNDVAAANAGQPRVVNTDIVKWSGAGVGGHWQCQISDDGTAATSLADHLQQYIVELRKYNCFNSGREVTDATSGPEEAFIQTCVDNGGVVTGGTISKYGYFVKKGTNKYCGDAVFATGSGVGGKVYCNLGDTATDEKVNMVYKALNAGRNGN